MSNCIYADHAATTRLRDEASRPCCPGCARVRQRFILYKLGREARKVVENARTVAEILADKNGRCFFNSLAARRATTPPCAA